MNVTISSLRPGETMIRRTLIGSFYIYTRYADHTRTGRYSDLQQKYDYNPEINAKCRDRENRTLRIWAWKAHLALWGGRE